MTSLSSQMKTLVAPSLVDFEPYDPKFTSTRINLSANENTHEMPAGTKMAVCEALSKVQLNRYPDPMANGLRKTIAEWRQCDSACICVGNGGDELLFNFLLAFGGQGRKLLNCPPSFSEYELFSKITNTEVVNVWRNLETFCIDEEAALNAASDANLVILTSPNNPTGDVVSREFVSSVCEVCPGIVMVDEAYDEFSRKELSCDDLLGKHDNLITLHTLSKAFGLAGIRCGYIIASPDIIDVFASVRQIYSVNALTQAVAAAVIANRDEYQGVCEDIKFERQRLLSAFNCMRDDGLPIEVWPSESNFLLVRVPDATFVHKRLRDEFSILVRDFSSTAGLKNCLRIAVGTQSENDELIEAIKTILSTNN